MKKVIGLCLVMVLSSASLFAQDGRRGDKKMAPAQRCERMISELKLNDTQAAEFRKIHENFMKQAEKERAEMNAFRDKQREKMKVRETEMNVQLKKVLTDEQYKLYLEKKQFMEKKQSKGKKHRPGNGRN